MSRADLAAALRDLANRVDTLDPARVVGELEALKFSVWTANVTTPATPAPPEPTSAPTLDVRAAAKLLDISPTTLRRLVANDEIPHLRVGRRMLFRRATVERFAADRERCGRERS